MQKEKTILFLHGFYASGSCVPALALKEAFEKGGTQRPGESLGGYRTTILTPDLPLHPADAVRLILEICDQEKPDILVGNSCGSFYAQMISPIIGVPALLGNPHFKMSDFLRERIGNHQYKSPRRRISLTAAIYIIRFVYGASLVRKTRWRTSSHCFWNTIITPFTSQVDIHQQQSNSRPGMCPLSRN